MSTKKISVDQLAAEITRQLEAYSEQVADGTKEAIEETAEECRKDIIAGAPKRTGAYKRSWRVAEISRTPTTIKVIIHSKNRYQLAHLLEKGHVLRNGGRSRAFPHIEPARDAAEKKLLKRIEVVVKA